MAVFWETAIAAYSAAAAVLLLLNSIRAAAAANRDNSASANRGTWRTVSTNAAVTASTSCQQLLCCDLGAVPVAAEATAGCCLRQPFYLCANRWC